MGKRATGKLLVALFAVAFALGLAPMAAFAAPGSGLTSANVLGGGLTAQDDEGFAIEYQGLVNRGDDEDEEWWLAEDEEFGYTVTYDGVAVAAPEYETALYREEWDEDSEEPSYLACDELSIRTYHVIYVFQKDPEGFEDDGYQPDGVDIPKGYHIAYYWGLFIEGPYPIDDEDYAGLEYFKEAYRYTGEPVTLDFDIWVAYGDDEDSYDLAYYRYDAGSDEYVEIDADQLVEIGDYRAVFTGEGDYSGAIECDFRIIADNDFACAEIEVNGETIDDDDVCTIAEGDPIDIEVRMPVFDEDEGYDVWHTVDEDAYTVTYAYDDGDMTPCEGVPADPGEYVVVVQPTDDAYVGSKTIRIVITSTKDLDYARLVFDDDFDGACTSEDFTLSEAKAVSIDIVAGGKIVPSDCYTLMLASVKDDEESAPVTFSGFTAAGEYVLYVEPSEAGEKAGYTGGRPFWIDVYADNDISLWRTWDIRLDGDDYNIFEGSSMPAVKVTRENEAGDEEALASTYYSVKYEICEETQDEEGDWVEEFVPVAAGAKVVKDAEYRVTVTGKNGYSGTRMTDFRGVSLHDLEYATVTSNANSPWIAQGQPLPKYTVSINSKPLNPGVDYEIAYYDEDADEDADEPLAAAPTKPGYYRVEFKGIGEYESEAESEYFWIVPANSFNLAAGSVTVGTVKAEISNGYRFTVVGYTGAKLPLNISLTMNGKPVGASSYTQLVTYNDSWFHGDAVELDNVVSDIKEPGYYEVTLTPKGDSGYVDAARIRICVTRDLSESDVSLSADSFDYTGKAIRPDVTVKVDGRTLSSDYFDVEYSNNVKPGVGIAAVYFYGPYSGRATKTFVISDPASPVAASDAAAASSVAKMIAELPGYVSTSADQAAVDKAQAAYGKLSTAQKALVGKRSAAALKTAVAQAASYAKKHAQATKPAKAVNPMTVKAKAVKAKAKKLKKKAQKIAANKAFVVNNPQGKVSYKLTKITAKKKLAKQAKKKIKVGADGKITLGKKLKKGTYKLTVQVTAAGNAKYNAAVKTVTVTVKVK